MTEPVIPENSALSRYVDDLRRDRDEQKTRADGLDQLNAGLHERLGVLLMENEKLKGAS